MPTPDADRFVPIGEAAALAGVSIDTMRRWEREGRLTAQRTAGGQRRFKRSDVIALLSPSEHPNGDAA